ncbi:MAG: hypothetical protein ACTHJM_06160 [Marmoricola sp.]
MAQRRSTRRIVEATACAAIVGGVPSTVYAGVKGGGVAAAAEYGVDATARIGVLLPPFRPGLVRGVIAHLAISMLAGSAMARLLPLRRSRVWGTAAGAAMGWCNLVVIGRRIPAIAEVPLVPGLADNLAFGFTFAVVADRAVLGGRVGTVRGDVSEDLDGLFRVVEIDG